MRPYILKETNWKTVKNASFDLAILPWGATEAHNYHLPYGTDNYQAESIAEESARIAWNKNAKLIVLPIIPFGVNTGQSDIFLDINLNPSTQFSIISDIITVLNRQGIYKLLIFNGHGGNNFKPLIRELGLKFPKMFIAVSNWFQVSEIDDCFDNPGDHADEIETSLMLHLYSNLVLPKDEWGLGLEKKYKMKGFSEGWLWAERKWSEISEDTGVGNPSLATAKKGEVFFKVITEKISKVFCEICEADLNDLYE